MILARGASTFGIALAFCAISSTFAVAKDEVTLTIRLPEGKSQFHVGEIIPVELEYMASTAGVFAVETIDYDRSGRLGIEKYEVEPAGRDPLEFYYSEGGFMGGGISGGPRTLGVKPVVFHHDLNEWVALDKPGQYTLTVESRRVRSVANLYSSKSIDNPTRSNTLKFEIIASDPVWQERIVDDAVSVIDSSSTDDETKKSATRKLRFLGTPAAIKASVRELGKRGERQQWDLMAGLFSAPDRQLVIRELDRGLSDPDLALSSDYLFAIARLEAPMGKRLPYPEKGSAAEKKRWQDSMQADREEITTAENAAYERAASYVSVKRGHARSETIRTLVRSPFTRKDGAGTMHALISDSDIASAFLSWPVDEQSMILATFRDQFKSPAMKNALKTLLDSQAENLLDQKYTILRTEAMRLLYELDPESGRKYFLADIMKPRCSWWGPRFFLPDETLPKMDGVLGQRIGVENNIFKDTDAQMIGRYATRAILPAVKASFNNTQVWRSCYFEDGLIAYFLRVDPNYGIAALREKSNCRPSGYDQSIDTALKRDLWLQVEPVMIDRLNDPNTDSAQDAAKVLGKHGTDIARLALLERLRSLHSDWSKRQKTFNPGNYPPWVLEQALIGALGSSTNWQLSDSDVSDMESLALADVNKGVAAQYHWKSPVDVELNGDLDMSSLNYIPITGSDALIRKIGQYPRGTAFIIKLNGAKDRLEPILAALNRVSKQKGLVLSFAPAAGQP